jgi:hypothetical protein
MLETDETRHRIRQELATPVRTSLADDFGLIIEDAFAVLRGVTKEALRNERSRGDGPAFTKLGQRVFYYRESIEKYLAARTVTPTRQPPLLMQQRKPKPKPPTPPRQKRTRVRAP